MFLLLPACFTSSDGGGTSSYNGHWVDPGPTQDIIPSDVPSTVTVAAHPLLPSDINYPGSATPLWNLDHPGSSTFYMAPSMYDSNGNPSAASLWPLSGTPRADINAPMAWAQNTDCSNITVAVIDSGIDLTHPDLIGNIVSGWNFIGVGAGGSGSSNVQDDLFHGTFVSGIIGAHGNNGQGIAGICWHAKILPIKVFDSSGRGASSDIIEGIYYAQQRGAQVTNNSYGGYYDPDHNSADLSAMQEYYQAIQTTGALFVTAAGNGVQSQNGQYVGVNIDTYAYKEVPAVLDSQYMITVANTNNQDQLSTSSNFGPLHVQIAAPGELVTSTYLHNETPYLSGTGTSFSVPHVVGAAALYWAAHPEQDALHVKSRLLLYSESVPALNGLTKFGTRLNVGDLMNQKKGTRQ